MSSLPSQKAKYRQRLREGLCGHCGVQGRLLVTQTGCQICKDKVDSRAKVRWLERRKLIFDHYGRACVCCGEAEFSFLTIDHINNDGHQDRKDNPGASTLTIVFRYFKKHGIWRDDMQVLCWNCNLGKSLNGGTCPHTRSTR